MLSRRNLTMMLTMMLVVLVLFLSSVVLKEYFNDYDVNHGAEAEFIQRAHPAAGIVEAQQRVLYVGSSDTDTYRAVQEWAGYRKKTVLVCSSLTAASEGFGEMEQNVCLLVDGELLTADPNGSAALLRQYTEAGGVVIFYRLPPYETIRSSGAMQELLGIQRLRGETVSLREIWLYSGFLLGGETHYSKEGAKNPGLADLDWDVPWYDISAGTKTYMVGILTAEEKADQKLNNEDQPAIIWRHNLGDGSVFGVNGSYLEGTTALGLLDAMLYEARDYALYPVVNAQNLSFAGFPSLTRENDGVMAEIYGMTNRQFCRDILWPSLVAVMEKGGWKGSAFLSVKQSDRSGNDPSKSDLIAYLKYFNEDNTEAGVSLGRVGGTNLNRAVKEEASVLASWGLSYTFTSGYLREENASDLPSILTGDGTLAHFQSLRTVVREYVPDQQVLSWLGDNISIQSTTTDAFRHSDRDSLRLKSLETALGYSNIMVNLYQVLWPAGSSDGWENHAEQMASNVDTYWKPFAAFEKTTITESDRRVRNVLNGRLESGKTDRRIDIRTEDFTGEYYLLLRTHGEEPTGMSGGTWTQVERNTYLLRMTEGEGAVYLGPEHTLYYQE